MSRFEDGNANFFLTGSGTSLVFVTSNIQVGGGWILQHISVENKTCIVKGCLKYSSIELDVNSTGELCRFVFTKNRKYTSCDTNFDAPDAHFDKLL
jgi:hypothetical protein